MRSQEPPRPLPNLEGPGLPSRRRWPSWLPRLPLGALLVLPVFGALLLPVGELAHYSTSSPQACLNCHDAGDTPSRGVRSLVHPGFEQVTCVDCHGKSGGIIYEGYVNGFAAEPERVSPACARCHADMRSRNDQDGFKFNSANIQITHGRHLERGATCVSCHTNVAHDLRTSPTNRPRMDYCYSCHTRAESCDKCHRGKLPDASASLPFTVTVAGNPTNDGRALYLRDCSGCHGPDGTMLANANLGSKQFLQARGAENLASATKEGRGAMPPMGGQLSDKEISGIVEYLLTR